MYAIVQKDGDDFIVCGTQRLIYGNIDDAKKVYASLASEWCKYAAWGEKFEIGTRYPPVLMRFSDTSIVHSVADVVPELKEAHAGFIANWKRIGDESARLKSDYTKKIDDIVSIISETPIH